MTGDQAAGNDRDSGVVEELCGYLTSSPSESFFLFAGAGSGKTRTLVEVLRRLTGQEEDHEAGKRFAERLSLRGQAIRTITYTVNAVNVINGRLGTHHLSDVSTIHSFCWDLISGFDDDLRDALIAINREQLEEAKQNASQRRRGPTPKDQETISKYKQREVDLRATQKFVYFPDRNSFGEGALAHAHVLSATAWLLENRPTLRRILANRYPVILIDESQDTMKGVLGALVGAAEKGESRMALGLIGDHRQKIYPEGLADLPGRIPQAWRRPSLAMNHRSQRRIVALINSIWEAQIDGRTEPTGGGHQHARTEKAFGAVRLFVGDATLSEETKVARERLCASEMAAESKIDAWNPIQAEYQTLALEHKLAAQRGGFLNVFLAVDTIDQDAARPQWHGHNVGPASTRLLLEELPALASCIEASGRVDEFAVMEVLSSYERLDVLLADGAPESPVLKGCYEAVQEFAQVSRRPSSTVREVLRPVVQGKLFALHPDLEEAFREHAALEPVGPKKDESRSEARQRGLAQLLNARWEEVKLFHAYLEGRSLQATHLVVKGSEFEHIMVVMDDEAAGGFLFSYDKLFGAKPLTKTDRENADSGKETAIDRTLRLLYVTCSRARESLVLVLWASDPQAALSAVKASNWFEDHEVSVVPEG